MHVLLLHRLQKALFRSLFLLLQMRSISPHNFLLLFPGSLSHAFNRFETAFSHEAKEVVHVCGQDDRVWLTCQRWESVLLSEQHIVFRQQVGTLGSAFPAKQFKSYLITCDHLFDGLVDLTHKSCCSRFAYRLIWDLFIF